MFKDLIKKLNLSSEKMPEFIESYEAKDLDKISELIKENSADKLNDDEIEEIIKMIEMSFVNLEEGPISDKISKMANETTAKLLKLAEYLKKRGKEMMMRQIKFLKK